ncbi:MAG: helix-hairpin-helix domain-containing protein [Deltaproteobacteria bacterium]|nr:helix-hairpin-helix domain-containing protein [Deltaproteobacteria bacterium]MBW2612423.1 helix-hairpin-helix domain-containing protein [Deltaproteobacteria bacterium]MBW2634221.1 helix-hairpin-helix domain-containing protein [Deltaproteobacteria bacterium]MBW2677665.1 helix-hairpin-helix domain-containing protein [Deltaproteobacteria bacterium]
MYRTKQLIALCMAMAMIMIFAGSAMAEAGPKININTAGVEELVQLDRVGPKYAERIVTYRTENGPFTAPEDIMLVAGIGEKTFEVNKDRIAVK